MPHFDHKGSGKTVPNPSKALDYSVSGLGQATVRGRGWTGRSAHSAFRPRPPGKCRPGRKTGYGPQAGRRGARGGVLAGDHFYLSRGLNTGCRCRRAPVNSRTSWLTWVPGLWAHHKGLRLPGSQTQARPTDAQPREQRPPWLLEPLWSSQRCGDLVPFWSSLHCTHCLWPLLVALTSAAKHPRHHPPHPAQPGRGWKRKGHWAVEAPAPGLTFPAGAQGRTCGFSALPAEGRAWASQGCPPPSPAPVADR